MDGTMDEGLPLPLAERISSRGWTLIDVGLAMFLVSGSIVGIALGNHRGPNGDGWDVLRYLLAVAACVPLPLRRRYPNQVLGVMGLAVVALLILGAHGPVQV
ncbi:MAG: hypothetical protein M3N98_03845, partial [Actinomycetota bacterium]|nr:hypothetical protein [Actinomycetota bacterium]